MSSRIAESSIAGKPVGRLVHLDARLADLRQRQSFAGDNSLAKTIETRTKRGSDFAYRFPAGHGLAAEERSMIAALSAELSDRLERVVPPDATRFVARIAEQLHASFKARAGQSSDQAVYDGFLMALPGHSGPAIQEAVRRLIRCEAPEDYSTVFTPTPTDLARLTIHIEREWRHERDRLLRLLTLAEERPVAEEQPSEEVMAAARERLRKMREAMAARSAMPAQREATKPSPAGRVADDIAARRDEQTAPLDR